MMSLIFIGGGNMAEAVLRGGLDAGVVDADRVHVADPGEDRRTLMASLGATVHEHATEALRTAPDATVVLAVKPQMLRAVHREVGELPGRAIISILAGTPVATIRERFGTDRIVRVMPNTPARLRRGMSAIARGPGATDEDVDHARRLAGAVGDVVVVDESLMDAFTALAGSGPAYVFYLAEAMAAAGERLGFDRETALRIVRATIDGSGGLLADSEQPPSALRAMVTSRGGTTAAATDVFDESGMYEIIIRALRAARDRGVELASES